MYQRKVINNPEIFLTRQQHFTHQRKGNHELQVQALNLIVADLQNQKMSYQHHKQVVVNPALCKIKF